jgi:LCP family protein required for cell wall assembly
MIVHVPQDRRSAYLISIPRDTEAHIPAFDRSGYAGGTDKINAAFFFGAQNGGGWAGGAQLTAQTVKRLTGLGFDGTVTVTYGALRKLTDAVGGVRMCLDQAVKSVHSGHLFPAGCQHLDGRSSMDLLRQRYGLPGGGHDRDRNGQRYLRALLAKATAEDILTNPAKLSGLLRAAGDGLTVDTGSVPLVEMVAVLREIRGADAVGIGWSFGSTTTGGGGRVRLNPALSESLFDAIRRDVLHEWVLTHPQQVTR